MKKHHIAWVVMIFVIVGIPSIAYGWQVGLGVLVSCAILTAFGWAWSTILEHLGE
jgi:hypothetical protein